MHTTLLGSRPICGPTSLGEVLCICFDMSAMSAHTVNSSFEMENLRDARLQIDASSWLTKLDLKDAYHTISVDPLSRDQGTPRAERGLSPDSQKKEFFSGP